MGSCKVVAKSKGKVVFVHQLSIDGTAYAEDVTIEAQPGVEASRVDWTDRDGQVGNISWVFTPTQTDPTNIRFPED